MELLLTKTKPKKITVVGSDGQAFRRTSASPGEYVPTCIAIPRPGREEEYPVLLPRVLTVGYGLRRAGVHVPAERERGPALGRAHDAAFDHRQHVHAPGQSTVVQHARRSSIVPPSPYRSRDFVCAHHVTLCVPHVHRTARRTRETSPRATTPSSLSGPAQASSSGRRSAPLSPTP
eukprot:263060-Rhodomonas_salina.4